ncbi:membrane protein [Helicobacter pylori PZ5086]|nr:membrane protein [Helicobacter pylori PZ5086]
MNIKERLSDWEYRWAVALVYGGCISITARIFYDINGSASDPIFDPKYSYYVWLAGLIAALLSNLLFNPKGRSAGYLIAETWQGFPKFFKAIFKARFFGAFYDAVLGARLRDFYVMLLTIPFIIAMHEISAYCGHPSNLLVEGLVILGFQGFLKLCAKWGW